MNNKGFSSLVTILVALAIVLVGGAVWYFSPQDTKVMYQPLDETANWKTYTNKQYGFEFKYPSYYGNVSLGEKEVNPVGIDVNVYDRLEHEGIYSEVVNLNCNSITGNGILFVGVTEISGVKFCKGKNGDYSIDQEIYFTKSDYGDSIISISFWRNYDLEEVNKADPEAVLSTFKFISPMGISDWKTYRNEKLGFSLEYPPDWVLDNTVRGDTVTSISKRNCTLFVSQITSQTYDQSIDNCSISEVFLNGIDAKKLQCNSKEIASSKNGYYYQRGSDWLYLASINEVSFRPTGIPSKETDVDCDQPFSSILSTFKFTSPISSSSSQIQVISPTGGEQWKRGETYTISWNGAPKVFALDLKKTSSGDLLYIAGGLENPLPSKGSYQWTIPVDVSLGSYTIVVLSPQSGESGMGELKSSNIFSITDY